MKMVIKNIPYKAVVILLSIFLTIFSFYKFLDVKAANQPIDLNSSYHIARYNKNSVIYPPGNGTPYYPNSNEYLEINTPSCATDSGINLSLSSEKDIAIQNFYIRDVSERSTTNTLVQISSPFDLAGCLTVCGNIEASAEVKFALEDQSLKDKQTFIISYKGDTYNANPYYEISLAKNENLKVGFSGNKLILSNSNSSCTYFRFIKCYGNEIKTNLAIDNDSFDYGSTNLNRIGNPLSNGEGRVSKMFSLGINGIKKEYNDIYAYTINPTNQIENQIKLNFVLTHSYTDENLEYCKIDGNTYKLAYDSLAGYGTIIIEFATSIKDGFRELKSVKPPSDKLNNEITLSNELLKGSYIRVSYIFKLSDGENNKFIRETSDIFFISYSGFGIEDSGVLKITDNHPTIAETTYDGLDVDVIKKGLTLTDGALVINGFSLEKIKDCYDVAVKNVTNNSETISLTRPKQIFNEFGAYDITITSLYGERYDIRIYNLGFKNGNEDINSLMIDKYFGNVYQGTNELGNSFISGERILSGSSSELDRRIKLPYSWVDIPVYYNSVTYNLNSTSNLPILRGTITKTNMSDIEVRNIESSRISSLVGELKGEGLYNIILTTINDTGYQYTFNFNFMIVEDEPKPLVNETIIKTMSQETYDLVPTYYGVSVEVGSYRYFEEGVLVEKNGVLIYAFSSYEAAVNFSLKVEKRYSTKQISGNYIYLRYSNTIELDEFDLFTKMYENAKKNVKQGYFSIADENINKSISVSDYGEAYQLSFSRTNNLIIVTTSIEEREKLTCRRPYINNYQFINLEIDSNEVKLINKETLEEYKLTYDKTVEEQLEEKNAKTGEYKVVERTKFNRINEYDVIYVAKGDNQIYSWIKISGIVWKIDNSSNGKSIEVNNSFVINSVENELDKYGLILITYGSECNFYDISKIKNLEFNDKGIYKIEFIDRLGNTYAINIEIC